MEAFGRMIGEMDTNQALELAVKLASYGGRRGISATTVANYLLGRPDYETVTPREREAARDAMETLQRLGLAKIVNKHQNRDGSRSWTTGTRIEIL